MSDEVSRRNLLKFAGTGAVALGALSSANMVMAQIRKDSTSYSSGSSGDGVANVIRDYGAKGDGVSDDTRPVQAALNENPAIFFPPGKTFVTGTLKIAREKQVLYSIGSTSPFYTFNISGARLRLKGGANGPLISVVEKPGTILDGLELDGYGGEQSSGSVVKFDGGAYGVIRQCYIHHARNHGVLFCAGAGQAGDEAGIYDSFIFWNAGNGIHVDVGCGDYVISRNHILVNGMNGVMLDTCYDVALEGNNILSNNLHGVFASGQGGGFYSQRHTFTNNQVRNNQGHGFYFKNAAACAMGVNMSHFNSRATAGVYSGVCIEDSHGITLSGVQCHDVGASPSQKYGVEMKGSATKVSLVGCYLEGIAAPFVGTNSYKLTGNIGTDDHTDQVKIC